MGNIMCSKLGLAIEAKRGDGLTKKRSYSVSMAQEDAVVTPKTRP